MLQPPGAVTGRRAPTSNRRKTQESPDDVLRQLQRLAPNKKCADCNMLGPQSANLTIGSFVCITCSGILREINHRVKGIGHSSFTVEEADRMKQSNNEEINKLYLARFNPAHEHLKQPQGNSDQQLLRAWIRRKYHDKAWFKDGLNNAQPTVVKIPPKEAAPAVDLLGSYGSSPTPATNNESSWNAFGGSSQSQQQQQAPAFNASFPASFPSPQSPTSAFPANFGSSQTIQQQQQPPPPQSNFASFPAPNQNQQQPGFANFNQGVGAPDPSQQQQSFANFNQAQTAQPQFPNQQPPQPQQFANFNQQPSNAAQPHGQPGQQQQQPGPQGFASFNQPSVQVFHVQQAPDPFAQQGFGKVNPQFIQQAMFQGQQQQPQNVMHPGQLQQSHSMPLPQQNQQQQFVQQQQQQQQQVQGQVNQQQQQPQGVPGAGFASQSSFPGAVPQQNHINPQQVQNHPAGVPNQPAAAFASFGLPGATQSGPNATMTSASQPADKAANDTNASKEGSPSIGKSKFSAGQLVIYKSSSEVCSAKIAKVHFDDALDPFYTIVLENGKEKQTDDAHLDSQETLQSEINEILPSLTPVQLKQLHDFLTQLKGTSKPPASNGSSVSTGVQAQTGVSEQNINSVPSGGHANPSRSATPVPSGQPVAPSPAPSLGQQQDPASFIPSPTPPSKPPTHPQNGQGNLPPPGQYQSGAPGQSMQGVPPPGHFQPNAGPPQGQFQANHPGQGPQGVPPQGMMQSNQQGMQGIQSGFPPGSAGFAPNPGLPNNTFGQQPAPAQQQGGSSFIPTPPSVNNAVHVHPSGIPAPPLVPPPQQYQKQQFQQMQQQFQQMQPPQQQFQQMQPPQQQFQQMQPQQQQQLQPQNIPQPVAGAQPPNGEPASPMSPKGNPFDFY